MKNIQSLTTKELAAKLGMSLYDVKKENLNREDLVAMVESGVFKRGGKLKQSAAQYARKDYGSADKQKSAKPMGYRYKRIIDPSTGKIRVVTKEDKKYYKTPTQKEIKAFESGDKLAHKMLYFESRTDHSDKSPLKSLRKYAKGGSVSIGEHKAKYKVKYSLDGSKPKDGYIVSVMTPSEHAVDYYLLYDNKKELVKELRLQEAHELVSAKKITMVKSYDVQNTTAKNIKEKRAKKIPVKEMDYTEKKEFIDENIVPYLKSAVTYWNSTSHGSFDINDEKSKARYIDAVRKSADYSTERDFEKKTHLKVSESGREIETKDGDELDEVAADNTYNQTYLGLTDWDFKLFEESEDSYYVVARPHLGGDIRGGYGEAIFFEGESREDVLYKFREAAIDGGRSVNLEFKDGTSLTFDAQQDSDVSYYEYYEGGATKKKLKLNSPAELTLSTFKTFGSYNGDDFLETIVDEFNRSKPKKKTKKFEDGGGVGSSEEIKERLEYLREELRAERISYEEIAELQSLSKYIDPSDVELLEAAGVPEFDDDNEFRRGGDVKADKRYKALHAGKRTSADGNIYYEYRRNRSDKNRTKRFSDGGGVENDFATVYNNVVEYIMKDQECSYEEAVEIIDKENKESWIRDMVESEGETNASFIAEQILDTDEGEYKRGGVLKNHKQRHAQYSNRDVERYGDRDKTVRARPVGYRYKRIYDKHSGRLRRVRKDDKEYYGSVSKKDILAFEEGDKSAKNRVYTETRKDHSDKSVSGRGF